MRNTLAIGIAFSVIGAIIFLLAYRTFGMAADPGAFMTRYTDRTIWFLIIGMAGVIGSSLFSTFDTRPDRTALS